ncbi:MAG: serine hydroxymethyltransferase [Candidatus Omnitrophica bacterium]|nr:serine hydroxymethyltransferase [Candidatus Omnitrophota bacterium]MDD5080535.1 serine hydroxymethyltransferase [Candidatus Omnitrophota bacterium]MDD5441375.1 serine hydroxymethyltransferase [Candidatus Omnitrophota bacterium]
MYDNLEKYDPEIFKCVKAELTRQREHLELIASENFTTLPVMMAQGTVLTNKYAEGYPNARWYGGCVNVDNVETIACDRIKEIFNAQYANVQPHSGTQANMAVMMSVLEAGDTVLGMDLACGGHLSHGHPLNFSGRFFNIIPYGVNKETELLDYDDIEKLAVDNKPKLIIAGASAYPGIIDFKKFRAIADKVGAYLLVDMAHFAGLVAAKIYPNPCECADFVTTTTHKTLRGPRGGVILAKEEFAKKLNTAVFPGVQGGPLMHVIAAKAVAFKYALTEEFAEYQKQVAKNALYFCNSMTELGFRIVSGTTQSHLFLVDLRAKGITGKEMTLLLESVNITVNKNLIPYDTKSAFITSGIRIGTPAITARGMKEPEMKQIAELIDSAVEFKNDNSKLAEIKTKVLALTEKFPLYSELGS